MDIFIRNTVYTGPVRAVVLDWAGTAVDFGCMGPVAVFQEVFARRGVEVTVHEARAPMGS
jgi:phosphonoacetaldehyde hydrolase